MNWRAIQSRDQSEMKVIFCLLVSILIYTTWCEKYDGLEAFAQTVRRGKYAIGPHRETKESLNEK